MSDIRHRLEQLLADSGAYRQGRQDERLRFQQLIDARIDQLAVLPRTQQLSAELLLIRQQLEE
jgi:hypothetical protein